MNDLSRPPDFSKPVHDALQGALAVAYVGLPVFSCDTHKRPTCDLGFQNAVRSPDEVRRLWRRWPGILVGMPTGAISNLSVIDLDAKHPEARPWFEENRDRLPQTRVHRTRAGGLHLLYLYQPNLRCSVGKLARGVDVRSDGGYIIWWPAHGCEPLDIGDLAPFPGWVWEALKPPPPPKRAPFQFNKRDESAMRGLMRRIACANAGERIGAVLGRVPRRGARAGGARARSLWHRLSA
jgi:hypothetical protein